MSVNTSTKVVPIEEIKHLLEPEIYDKIKLQEIRVVQEDAINLLSHHRFDLAFKIFYLETLKLNAELAKQIYLEHIRAFSFGTFKEPNNDGKDSQQAFLEEFQRIYNDIMVNGFNGSKSLLPLSSRGFIRNGAHRLSAAIVANKKVSSVITDDPGKSFNSEFFYERNVGRSTLDIAATTFAEKATNTFIALIWPTAQGKDDQLDSLFDRMVYKKSVELNLNGAHNLMPQVYPNESWIGTKEDNFKGSMNKVMECFRNPDALRVYLFQAETLEEVLEIKQKVRDLFQVGKHSIHITDTHQEVLKLSKILFNDNSVHFLNNGKPNTFLEFHENLKLFKQFIAENNIDENSIALDTSMILSLYGIRKSSDIDYISANSLTITKEFDLINSHNDDLANHATSVENLLYNPEYYFYFNNIKFISFNQLYKFKGNRASEKDKIDVSLMEALVNNDHAKYALEQRRQRIHYLKHRLKYLPLILGVRFLKKIGLYKIVRSQYHNLKQRK